MKVQSLVLASLLALAASSCKDTPDLPDEPQISFVSANLVDSTDVLGNELKVCKLFFEFTDGDGDIGFRPGDSLPPFDTGSVYYNNLWVDYYEWEDSNFVFVDLQPPYDGRISNLTPDGQNKTLIGTILYDMDISGLEADTFRFEVKLIDRALNESNLLVTPPIIRD